MEKTGDSPARREALARMTDESVLAPLASLEVDSLNAEFLVPEELELRIGDLVDEPLHLSACGVVDSGNSTGDFDMNFLSDLLQSDNSSQAEFLPSSNESGSLTGVSSPANSCSSDAANVSSSTPDTEAKKTLLSSPSSLGAVGTELELE
ncbi:hypothetical protein PInf_001593 [Phytophthora infestans]|nr:hypothetical protein PInf_001593 [Phytophthora infestans]